MKNIPKVTNKVWRQSVFELKSLGVIYYWLVLKMSRIIEGLIGDSDRFYVIDSSKRENSKYFVPGLKPDLDLVCLTVTFYIAKTTRDSG